MFWEQELCQSSSINDLLAADNCDLVAIIEDELVMQEIRADNEKLIEFLRKTDNLVSLVKLALTEAPITKEVNRIEQYRLPTIAAQLLSLGKVLSPNVAKNDECMELLLNYMNTQGNTRLNSVTASLFAKVIGSVFSNAIHDILPRLKSSKPSDANLMNSILTNMDMSSMIDLLYKMTSSADDDDAVTLVKECMITQSFGAKIISQLLLCKSSYTHEKDARVMNGRLHDKCDNIALFYAEIVRTLREIQFAESPTLAATDPFLVHLHTGDIPRRLIKECLAPPYCCQYLISAVCVILTQLLRIHTLSKSPSVLCDDALSAQDTRVSTASSGINFGGADAVTMTSDATEEPGRPSLSLNTLPMRMSVTGDDNAPPLSTADAQKREEIEHLLVENYAVLHAALVDQTPKALIGLDAKKCVTEAKSYKESKKLLEELASTMRTRIDLIRVLSSLLNNDYSPSHIAIHKAGTLPVIIVSSPFIFGNFQNFLTTIPPSVSVLHSALFNVIANILFSRVPITEETPAFAGSDRDSVAGTVQPKKVEPVILLQPVPEKAKKRKKRAVSEFSLKNNQKSGLLSEAKLTIWWCSCQCILREEFRLLWRKVTSAADVIPSIGMKADLKPAKRTHGKSPLIGQLLVDCHLIETVMQVGKLDSPHMRKAMTKMERIARRSHLLYVTRLIETARLRSANGTLIEETLKEARILDGWLRFVDEVYRPYMATNLPDNVRFDLCKFIQIQTDGPIDSCFIPTEFSTLSMPPAGEKQSLDNMFDEPATTSTNVIANDLANKLKTDDSAASSEKTRAFDSNDKGDSSDEDAVKGAWDPFGAANSTPTQAQDGSDWANFGTTAAVDPFSPSNRVDDSTWMADFGEQNADDVFGKKEEKSS